MISLCYVMFDVCKKYTVTNYDDVEAKFPIISKNKFYGFGFMLFNTTFNNISVKSWLVSFIGEGNRST